MTGLGSFLLFPMLLIGCRTNKTIPVADTHSDSDIHDTGDGAEIDTSDTSDEEDLWDTADEGTDTADENNDTGEEEDTGEEDTGEEDAGEEDTGDETDTGEEDTGEEDTADEDTGEPQEPEVSEECVDAPLITYSSFGQGFIDFNCQGCHGSGAPNRQGAPESVTFDNHEEVLFWLERIYQRTHISLDMPPALGIFEEDQERLRIWIDCWEGI